MAATGHSLLPMHMQLCPRCMHCRGLAAALRGRATHVQTELSTHCVSCACLRKCCWPVQGQQEHVVQLGGHQAKPLINKIGQITLSCVCACVCVWGLTMSLTSARQGVMTSCASLPRLVLRLGPAAAVAAWQTVQKATQLRCRAAASDTCWSWGGAPPEHRRPTAG